MKAQKQKIMCSVKAQFISKNSGATRAVFFEENRSQHMVGGGSIKDYDQ